MPPIASREPMTDALLDRMVHAIVDDVGPDQVILFGSRGRGDEREASDVDLIVVEAEQFGPGRSRHKELVRLYHALAGLRVPRRRSCLLPRRCGLLWRLPQPRPGTAVA